MAVLPAIIFCARVPHIRVRHDKGAAIRRGSTNSRLCLVRASKWLFVRTKSIDLGSSGGSSSCVAAIGGPIATPMSCLNKRKRHGSTVFNDFSVDATQSERPQTKTSKSSSESSSANVAPSSGPFSSYSFPCRSNRPELLKTDLPPGVGQSGLQRRQLSFQRERGAVEGAVDE